MLVMVEDEKGLKELISEPWFEWEWIYEHSKSHGKLGIEQRRVKCSLYEQDGGLKFSTTYRATAFQSSGVVPGLSLAGYDCKILDMHIFDVASDCVSKLLVPTKYLKSWTSRWPGRIVDVNEVVSGVVKGKLYVGKVQVFG